MTFWLLQTSVVKDLQNHITALAVLTLRLKISRCFKSKSNFIIFISNFVYMYLDLEVALVGLAMSSVLF